MGRELTKRFESHFSGTLEEAVNWIMADKNNQRGEFVIVLAGCSESSQESKTNAEAVRVAGILGQELSLKKAVALAAEITGARKNSLYTSMIELKNNAAE